MKKNRIKRMTKEDILDINNCESLPTYESNLLGKMTKLSFQEKDKQASGVLDLIHSDVCGLMNIGARGRYYYFITFTDDLSR